MTGKVELGFVEKTECPEELTSPYFPSKVGGRPSWLDPTLLPTPEQTACSVCSLPRTFLLQVYAPLEDTPGAFHRTLYLFVCLNPSCHQRNSSRGFGVFRSQLPKNNSFYNEVSGDEEECCGNESASVESESSESGVDTSKTHTSHSQSQYAAVDSLNSEPGVNDQSEAVDSSTAVADSLNHLSNHLSLNDQGNSDTVREEGHGDVVSEPTPLCVVCGSAGPKKCSRCTSVHYCSRHHQTRDWRNGHKLFCSDLASGQIKLQDVTYDPSHRVCLPEFLLVTEEEPVAVLEDEEEGERGEEERMKDYHKFVRSDKYRDHGSASKSAKKRVESVMEKAESGTTSDKAFRAFRRRVSHQPEQVSAWLLLTLFYMMSLYLGVDQSVTSYVSKSMLIYGNHCLLLNVVSNSVGR